MRFETLAVHAGGAPDSATGAVAPPIHLATTFLHGPAAEPLYGRLYIREGNPTEERLEAALAALDGGVRALAFASGMAAASVLADALPDGARIVFHRELYRGVQALGEEHLGRWGKRAATADLADLDAARAALAAGAEALWIETPTNPGLAILDLAALAALARAAGALLVVDGTFATPALQRPLAHGADVVLHSTTKYLGGHSDVQGGALVFAPGREELAARCAQLRHDLGAVAAPFNSWLVLRGLRTLACRLERHSANALAVARALAGHPALAALLYPGLASHPGHEIARRQMSAFGGLVSLRLAGGRAAALRFAARLTLFTNATSLGGVESLVEHRASSEGPGSTTPDDLVRLSVGLEHPDDLVEDLRSALTG
jgi:cystathionine gamma-synthase